MKTLVNRLGYGSRWILTSVLVAAWSVAWQPSAQAQLYTDILDPLIAEMEARAAALSNATEKVDLKRKKTLEKLLLGFNKKPSTSYATDLKLLGKATKKLVKVYPEEFGIVAAPAVAAADAPPVGAAFSDFLTLIQQAYEAYGGDLWALLDEAQTLLDGAFEGSCKDKAQAALNSVIEQLEGADAAPDLVTAIKILSKAAKTALKGQSLVSAAIECLPGGGGGGSWYDWLFGMTVDGTGVSAYQDARVTGPDDITVTYFANGSLLIYVSKQDGSFGVNLNCNVGNPIQKVTRPLSGIYTEGYTNVFNLIDGSLTVTKAPGSLPGQFVATFQFTATGTGGSRTVTMGSLSVWLYPPPF